MLAVFFEDQRIYWWQALILLLMLRYYVKIMMNNVRIYDWIATRFLKIDEKQKEDNIKADNIASQTRVAQGLSFNDSDIC